MKDRWIHLKDLWLIKIPRILTTSLSISRKLQWMGWRNQLIIFLEEWTACRLMGLKSIRLLHNLPLTSPELWLRPSCTTQIAWIWIFLLHLRRKPAYSCKSMKNYLHQLHWNQHFQKNIDIYSSNLYNTCFLFLSSQLQCRWGLLCHLESFQVTMTRVLRKDRIESAHLLAV